MKESDTVSLAELGEDEVVRRLVRGLAEPSSNVHTGAGDDCAVLRTGEAGWYQLFKTDCLVQGVHYTAEASRRQVGWKALCRCLSDVAAMGGRPGEALITVIASPRCAYGEIDELYAGINEAAARHGVSVVGGELSRPADENAGLALVSVALLGSVKGEHLVLRSGGSPGDTLWVTGRLGGSLRGRHLTFEPRLAEGQWLAKNGFSTAMMDLSDGLGRDLPRLAESSGVAFRVEREWIPCQEGCGVGEAIGDGEDYELLFAVAPEKGETLAEAWAVRFPDVDLTRIGSLCRDGEGEDLPAAEDAGWDPFRSKLM